jgi:SAM-dependent methyltransferase
MLQSSSRYENEAVAAVYLEAEWSDMLFHPNKVQTVGPFDPMRQHATPSFYLRIANITVLACKEHSISPHRICDVGSATGRTIYELTRQLDCVTTAIALEPSQLLHNWSHRLLAGPPSILEVPTIGEWNSPGKQVLDTSLIARFRNLDKIQFLNRTLEQLTESTADFDLIVCCNLLDRHPSPRGLVNAIHQKLRPGGLLVLSSPLEFGIDVSDTFTDIGSNVRTFLPDSSWEIVSTSEEFYDLRLYLRKWVRYVSQVVISIRR